MKTLRNNIWRGIYAIIIGLIMVVFPDLTLKYLVIVIGIILLVIGGILLGIYLNARKNGLHYQRVPVEGVLTIVLGLMLVIVPNFFISILMLILGVLLVLTGIIQITDIIILQKHNIKLSWIFYIFPIITFSAGIVVVLNPFSSIETLMMFFGIASLFSGIIDIIDEIVIRSAWKKKDNESIMISEE